MIGIQHDFTAAPVVAGKFVPRPYQSAADEAIDRELQAHRSTLVCHPTGAGKTVLFCLQAAKRRGCLVIAHRDSLIRQAAEKLELATGEPIHIEKALERAHFGARYIVGSVQTLKGERLKRFSMRFPDVEFIIVDEAHRSTARSYRAIFEAYQNAKILGVTATPDRSDGVGLKAVFETVAHEYSIIDATADGWLTPIRFQPIHSEVNLDAVKVGRQKDGEVDFDQAQLDDAVSQEAGRIARSVLDAVSKSDNPEARLIVFCPGVKTAHAGAEAMNAVTPGVAAVVDGEMEDSAKRAVLESHRRGEVRHVFNCGVLLEGYDDATLTGVFDAAPTKSRLRAMQKWGRATRPWPGLVDALDTAEARRAAIAASPKPWAMVYDLVMNSSRHDVVIDGVDLLGGKDLPGPVSKRAKEILKEKGGDVSAAVKEAKDELRAKAAARRLAAATKVLIGKPRSIFDRAGVTFLKSKERLRQRPEDKATPAMRWKLGERGIPIPDRCSKRMFRRLLGLDVKREAKGLCRLGGVEWLRKFGVDAWSMTSSQAQRVRDAIKVNGFKKLTREQLAESIERIPGEDDI